MTRLVQTITRNRGRWAYGDLQPYDLSNRFGDGSRPGREDYTIFLGYDETQTEPELDHSAAQLEHFTPVARVGHSSPRATTRRVYRGRPSAPLATFTQVL